jgi:tetratricopeptide (TPR) repeat protein
MRISFKRREPSIISRADSAREAEQWQLAAGLYRIALDRTPRNPPIWVQYGHALKESGNRAEAETAYRTAIGYDPRDAGAYLQLGHVLKLQDKTVEAQAAYLQALAIDPSMTDAARELAALGRTAERSSPSMTFAGSYSVSVGALRTNGTTGRAARSGFRRRASVVARADRARDAGQWVVAARLYRKALDRNPRNPPIWVQYGHVLKESGNPAEAEKAYRRAISYDPANADSHLQLGHALKIQGKRGQAEACYLRAFARAPSLPHALQELTTINWSEAHLSELRTLIDPDQGRMPNTNIGRLRDSSAQAEPLANERAATAEVLHVPNPNLSPTGSRR